MLPLSTPPRPTRCRSSCTCTHLPCAPRERGHALRLLRRVLQARAGRQLDRDVDLALIAHRNEPEAAEHHLQHDRGDERADASAIMTARCSSAHAMPCL
jgi:hypothetical protein